jgi:hypothetical protein
MTCNSCGGLFGVRPSDFPGWNLLACVDCDRPIKLVPISGPRLGGHRPARKGDVNRALRAARRMQMRKQAT